MIFGDKMPDAPPGPLTEATLKQWLVQALAGKLSIAAADIDSSKGFEDHGLDSRAGIQLSGRLERLLECRLSPALLYQHPTIDALAAHLAEVHHLPRSS